MRTQLHSGYNRPGAPQQQTHVLLVFRMPGILQHQNRNRHTQLPATRPEMDHCHVSVYVQSQGTFLPWLDPHDRHNPEICLAYARPTQGEVPGRPRGETHRPRRRKPTRPIYIGSKAKNKPLKKKRRFGRGVIGKWAVVARCVERTDAKTLMRFLENHVAPGAVVYTDENRSYRRLSTHYRHATVSQHAPPLE